MIAIFAPVDDDGMWLAALDMKGLEELHQIAGEDSWQAIRLAMRFASRRLEDYVDRGWQFFWEIGGDPFAPDELLND